MKKRTTLEYAKYKPLYTIMVSFEEKSKLLETSSLSSAFLASPKMTGSSETISWVCVAGIDWPAVSKVVPMALHQPDKLDRTEDEVVGSASEIAERVVSVTLLTSSNFSSTVPLESRIETDFVSNSSALIAWSDIPKNKSDEHGID
jgi:hypothetical protein